jgi:hypothetical protein
MLSYLHYLTVRENLHLESEDDRSKMLYVLLTYLLHALESFLKS